MYTSNSPPCPLSYEERGRNLSLSIINSPSLEKRGG
jgi:hypothetical protein